jgi:hypothetical protein
MNRCPQLSLLCFASGIALAFMAPAAAAPALTFKFKTINIPGSTQVQAYGISEAGVVIGEYFDTTGLPRGFTLKGKTVTTVNDPKGLANLPGHQPERKRHRWLLYQLDGQEFRLCFEGLRRSPTSWVQKARPPATPSESTTVGKSWACTRTQPSRSTDSS